MLNIFKSNKKNFSMSSQTKDRIEKVRLKKEYTQKQKNLKTELMSISLNIENESNDKEKQKENEKDNNHLPDYINFVVILDYSFPKTPPKILSKTSFSFPSLVDGRDLINEICSNWNTNMRLVDIINKIPDFIVKVRLSKVFYFYGYFQMGALYDMKNFNNMLVNTFTCFLDIEFLNKQSKIYKENNSPLKNNEKESSLVLTDDSIILFEISDVNNSIGKLIFWSTLYSIIDAQINKLQKFIVLRLFDDEKNKEIQLKIKVDNILFFREALLKRMSNLQVRSESKKITKGQMIEKRLTDNDILNMKIEDVVENYKLFNEKIEKNELSYYNTTTFFNLTQKAVEYYSARNDENHIIYLNAMKTIFVREDIQKILYGDN